MPPRVADLPDCEFYACKNPQHDTAEVTVNIPGEESPVVVKSCLYHQAILTPGSVKYSVARTYRGEIELRPIPAEFAPPAEPTLEGEQL